MVLRKVITTPLTCGAQASVASRMRKFGLPPLYCRGRHGSRGTRRDLLPVQDRELALLALHQSRQALDPVAIVAIEDTADRAELRLVDVPAHDTVDTAAARFLGERDLEISDVAHRVLHLVLQKL